MSDRIEVNHGAMDSGSGEVVLQAKGLNEIMTNLESSLTKELGGNWEGQAKVTYQQTKAKWDASLADLTEFLNSLGGMLGEINQGWQDVDGRGAKFWG